VTIPDPVKKIGVLTVAALLMVTSVVSGSLLLTGEAQADWTGTASSLDPTAAYPNQTVEVTFGLTYTGSKTLTITDAVYEIDWGETATSIDLSHDRSVDGGATTNLTGSFKTPDIVPGNYSGIVNITGYEGLTDILSPFTNSYPFTFTIKEIPALAVTIEASTSSGTPPLDVSFSSTVKGGIGPYTYEWDSGDGSTGSSATFGHQYTDLGEHTASLTVTDSRGISVTENFTITVGISDLVVSIRSSVTNGQAPLTANIEADVSGGIGPYTYYWTTGDGGTFTGESFTYEYHEAGTYTVRLRVTDSAGTTEGGFITITVLSQSNQTIDPVDDSTLDIGSTFFIYIFVFVVASVAVVGFMIYHNRTRFRW
jgi:PKD repeat protein